MGCLPGIPRPLIRRMIFLTGVLVLFAPSEALSPAVGVHCIVANGFCYRRSAIQHVWWIPGDHWLGQRQSKSADSAAFLAREKRSQLTRKSRL